jgi:hypothetical protein
VGDDTLDNDGLEAPAGRWQGVITWVGLATTGVILYELTNQPALGTATLCLKFGWEDFKTARWLCRFDPWRARGRACWWMFVASGLWKIAALAVGVNLVVIPSLYVLSNLNGRLPPNRLSEAFKGAGLTSVACFGLSAIATTWAVAVAGRNRVRLWLDGRTGRYCRNGIWPPYGAARRRYNRLRILLASATATVCIVVVGGINVVVRVFEALGAGKDWGVIAWMSFIFVWMAGALWMFHLVAANFPAECWPPDELAALPGDPLQ